MWYDFQSDNYPPESKWQGCRQLQVTAKSQQLTKHIMHSQLEKTPVNDKMWSNPKEKKTMAEFMTIQLIKPKIINCKQQKHWFTAGSQLWIDTPKM